MPLGIALSITTIFILLLVIIFLGALRIKLGFDKPQRRRKKLRRIKSLKELHNRNWKSNEKPVWGLPSEYSSHNSEEFTSDYGSTLRFPAPAEEEEQSPQDKEENLQEINIAPPIQTK